MATHSFFSFFLSFFRFRTMHLMLSHMNIPFFFLFLSFFLLFFFTHYIFMLITGGVCTAELEQAAFATGALS